MVYNFNNSLQWSKSDNQYRNDKEAIMVMLHGCVDVQCASDELDKSGVDYVAKLRRGALVNVDAKARRFGASRQKGFSANNPLLAIERWSVMPGGKYRLPSGKTGWTLSECSIVDMILYTFDPDDTFLRYLLPFHPLRMAASRFIVGWEKEYGAKIQDNGRYESQCVFVPADAVISAMESTYCTWI